MNRREFLRNSIISAALASFPSTLHRIPSAGKPKKVIVVGAGLSGLTAGYELLHAGQEVTILEASTRPGGRVYTLRDPFPDQLYAEAGAIDFGDGFTNLLHYIHLFGIPLQELPFGKEVLFLRGRRIVLSGVTKPEWPLELTPEERELGREGLNQKYLGPAIQEVGNPLASDWPSSAPKYDQLTVWEYLRSRGLSQDATQLVSMSVDGEDYDHLSALQCLALQSFYGASKKVLTMKGGNDQLPKAFARALVGRVRYGAVVQSVSQSEGKASVSFSTAGTQHQMEADHVVLAIPFSVLRHLQIDANLSPGKREAIEKLRYESVMRVFLQFRSRFWSERGESGTSSTDFTPRLIVDHTSSQPGPRGILEAQMEGEDCKRSRTISDEQRIQWTAEAMEKVHPGVLANLEGGTSFSWNDETPFAQGAWTIYLPGEVSRFFPHVANPEGRIHFAGEHTSALAMTLEGAIESGRRAAREVLM